MQHGGNCWTSWVFCRLFVLGRGFLCQALPSRRSQGWCTRYYAAVMSGWSCPRGLLWDSKLPQLLLLSRGQILVIIRSVVPKYNVGHSVNFRLREWALLASIAILWSLLTSILVQVGVATATTTGKRGNLLGPGALRQWLCALVVKVSIFHRVKVFKISLIGINDALTASSYTSLMPPWNQRIFMFLGTGGIPYSWRTACWLCCSMWR